MQGMQERKKLAEGCLGFDHKKCKIQDVDCGNYNCDFKCCFFCKKYHDCDESCQHIRYHDLKSGKIVMYNIKKRP